MGLFAPAATPKDVVDLLHRRIVQAMKQPDIAERLATLGFNAMETTPAGLSDHMQAETAKWGEGGARGQYQDRLTSHRHADDT